MGNSAELKKEIDINKKKIHADSYPMSIGEVINMYRDGELEIHPEFQRFFRWTLQQKTDFIESILLGIPVPSFFVAQRDDGVWEVVDGMQRLSTILSFVNELKDAEGNPHEELVLNEAGYLKTLKGITWAKLDKPLQIDFKREKIDFKIIKKQSTADTKYELFQRLNTNGTSLSDQEVRNCVLIMTNPKFFKWLEGLSNQAPFTSCVQLSENQIVQRYDLELITRFIVFQHMEDTYSGDDIGKFLNENIVALAKDEAFDYDGVSKLFNAVFSRLDETLGEDAFRSYSGKKKRHKGAFSLSLFEAITYGVGKNIRQYDSEAEDDVKTLRVKIRKISSQTGFSDYSGVGKNARTRLSHILPFAKDYFKNA